VVALFALAEGYEIAAEFVEIETGTGRGRSRAPPAARRRARRGPPSRQMRRRGFRLDGPSGPVRRRRAWRGRRALAAARAAIVRSLITLRSRSARAASRGQALGNPKLAEARAIANANHTAGADAFADSVVPAIREAQVAGAKSLREIAAALNGRGIGTARGGKWAPQAVANVLRRVG
jgi:hypothetical protein